MKQLLRDAVGYAVASGCALLLDAALLVCLIQCFSWWYLAAAAASFLAGMAVNYALAVRFVFNTHRFRNRNAEIAGFFAIGAVGLGINVGIIYVLVELVGLHYLVAKCVAAGFTLLFNFIARRQLLFVQRSSAPEVIT